MERIEQARAEIDRIDQEMARLFFARMQAAKAIAFCKKEYGLPIFDPAREAEVIRKNSALVQDADLLPFCADFFTSLMEVSKKYQKALLCESEEL